MRSSEEPWIVTDTRMSCLVVEGELSVAVNIDEAKSALGKCLPKVGNVYNCAAFRLDDACETIFCIRRPARAALIFIDLEAPLGDELQLGELTQKIARAKSVIDNILFAACGVTLKMKKLRSETTAKRPN